MAHGEELAETAADPAVTGGLRALGPGDSLGRYRIERVLGQGGMGVVYAVHDPDLDRAVALKVLRGAAGDEARTRLLREARAMAKLSHPNVITVYEVGSAGPIDFVAMELIDGKSLADWLTERRRTPEEVLRIFRAAARGLHAAHQAGLVHRDFKPANVLVGSNDRVVVTDFGLARAYDDLERDLPASAPSASTPVARPGRPDAASLSSTLTRTGALLGTPAYMAPEQFAGLTAGPRSDQYAFSVALWEALAGGRPFRGATIDELRRAADAGQAQGADALPRRLRPILQRGMSREAADRYPDLAAMMTAVDRADRQPKMATIGITAGAAAIAAVAMIALWPAPVPAPSATPRPACPDPEAELAAAWSPSQAQALAERLAATPGAARELANGLDLVVARWRDAHGATCELPAGPVRDGRLSCLALVRDQVTAAVAVAGADPTALHPAGLLDEIDDPAGCSHPSAAARPPLPADTTARAALSALRVDASRGLMLNDDAGSRTILDEALARARAAPQHPAGLVEVLLAAGARARRVDDYARAEAMFDEAATVAETIAADGLRAAAVVGTAQCISERSSDPGQVRAALTKARAAVTRAGDPPGLVARLDLAAAMLALGGNDLDGAIAGFATARAGLERAGIERTTVTALGAEARLRAQRDRGDDSQVADDLLTDAIARAARLFGDDSKHTRGLRTGLAFTVADRDLERARALFASLPVNDQAPAGAVPLQARVVGLDGRPRTGAVVHVGKGLIALADGSLIGVSIAQPEAGPRRAATDADGRFKLSAKPDEVVVVVAGDLRSVPSRVRDLGPTITVRPTRSARFHRAGSQVESGARVVAITLADGLVDVDYQAVALRQDAEHWIVAGLPDAPRLQVIAARTGQGAVDYVISPLPRQVGGRGQPATVALPLALPGVPLEVVVRGDRLVDIPGASLFVITGHQLAGQSLKAAELGHRVFASGRLFSAYARPTDRAVAAKEAAPAAGKPGDLRARVDDVPSGPVTVCVLPFGIDVRDPRLLEAVPDLDQLEVHCRGIVVPVQDTPFTVVIETPAMQRPD